MLGLSAARTVEVNKQKEQWKEHRLKDSLRASRWRAGEGRGRGGGES